MVNNTSTPTVVKNDVPQESILRPPVFIIDSNYIIKMYVSCLFFVAFINLFMILNTCNLNGYYCSIFWMQSESALFWIDNTNHLFSL